MWEASSFLMVSALIIQSLFSHWAFREFLLMEGQIDSYEIVITAFWSNEHNHQIAKEDRVNLSWYACIYHQDMSRRKSEQSNQTVSDYPTSLSVICLHSGLASCFYLLPVSVVTDGAFGGTEHHVRVARRWFLCQGCQFRPVSHCFKWIEADDFWSTLI